jgi:hypothetical protein
MYHVLPSRTAQTTRQYRWEISAVSVSLDETRRNKCSSFSGLLYSHDCDAWANVRFADLQDIKTLQRKLALIGDLGLVSFSLGFRFTGQSAEFKS